MQCRFTRAAAFAIDERMQKWRVENIQWEDGSVFRFSAADGLTQSLHTFDSKAEAVQCALHAVHLVYGILERRTFFDENPERTISITYTVSRCDNSESHSDTYVTTPSHCSELLPLEERTLFPLPRKRGAVPRS